MNEQEGLIQAAGDISGQWEDVGSAAAAQALAGYLAKAWAEGRQSALDDSRPPLSGVDRRQNPYLIPIRKEEP